MAVADLLGDGIDDRATYDRLWARLKPFGQEHVLAFWSQLEVAGRQKLARQIDALDLELIASLHGGVGASEAWADLARRAAPPPAIRQSDRTGTSAAKAHQRGLAALEAGEVGVIIVAGGQGTRLGFEHPKGMFPIGPVSRATLFRILFERVLARSHAARVSIPIYLMTSPATHDETVAYLAENRYFGVPAADVTVFCQGTMPAVDAQSGKLLLSEPNALALSPDGHGGLLAALARSGALADARQRGIKQLFYTQVDNPMVDIGDPQFLGYHLEAGSELSTQVVAKRSLRDKVGNVVALDDHLRIIEYSDLNPLDDATLDRRAADGSPVFWAGNIAVHVIEREFLERMAATAGSLPFHFASKAVPFWDPASGERVEPAGPNATKFERFIFDLLPLAGRAIVYEVDGQLAFAPVKNAPGDATDTPQTVQQQMIDLARSWLEQAGVRVSARVAVEISPLFAQDATELAARIVPGLVVTEPRYFC